MIRLVIALTGLTVVLAGPSVPAKSLHAEQQQQFTGRQSESSGNWLSGSWTDAFRVVFRGQDEEPYLCSTTESDKFETGVCTTMGGCSSGLSYGSCGTFGVCCIWEKSCDQTSSEEITHFTSANSKNDATVRGTGECKLSVHPMDSNVCQYKVEFLEFDIIGPDANSVCVDDFMGIRGGTNVPKLCGYLKGQHMYVDVKANGGPLQLTIDTSSVRTYARKWNIRITQIHCNSPMRAPSGCLQFFNETSGTVRTFNYKRINAPESTDNRQIQGLNYGVCINSKVGYCSCTWTMSGSNDYTFTLSGKGSVPREDLKAQIGTTECRSDYVTIPGGMVEDANTKAMVPAERFCGTYFPEVKTTAQPFTLHYITDNDEEGDEANLGAELNFRLNLCHA